MNHSDTLSDNYHALFARTPGVLKELSEGQKRHVADTMHLISMRQPVTPGELAGILGINKTVMSHILKRLRALRWVHGQKHGREVFYSLRSDSLEYLIRTIQRFDNANKNS